MKKLIAVWIAVAISVGACVGLQENLHDPTEFELVCEKLEQETEATCDGVDEPLVLVTRLTTALGLLGLRPTDEAVVMVAPKEDLRLATDGAITQEMVIFHEIVHYVLEQVGLKESRCQSEQVARDWTTEVKGAPYDPNWKIKYGCVVPVA
jgi:hypothetical protein